jgi:hypothetical protein
MTLTTIISVSIAVCVAPLFFITFFGLYHYAYLLTKNNPKVIASRNRRDREIAVVKWKLKKLEGKS